MSNGAAGRVGAIACLMGAFFLGSMGCGKLKEMLDQEKEGKPCKGGEHAVCKGKDSELLCIDGKYQKRMCKGSGGCTTEGQIVKCAWGTELAGQKCFKSEDDEAVCADDNTKEVLCSGGTFIVKECRGPNKCETKDKKVFCDMSVQKPGDVCETGQSACTEDGKGWLECKDGKFVADGFCRGPKGCRKEESGVGCDRAIAVAGDPCDGTGAACTPEMDTYLLCKGNKMVETSKCRGPKKCYLDGTKVGCDRSRATVGDVCDAEAEGLASCNVDLTERLQCKSGKWVTEKKCKCSVEGTTIFCK